MTIQRLQYLLRRLVMPIDRHKLFEKFFLSRRPLNSHALTYSSDRALLPYQVRVPIELLYLGWSNLLQGQVLERPQQHVDALHVHLRGPEHPGQIKILTFAISSWVRKTIRSPS